MVSLLRPLVDIAVAEARDRYYWMVNFKRELRSLEKIVLLIEDALPEAEDHPKIRDWSRELDDICCDTRDILDEFVIASKRVKSNSFISFILRLRLTNKIKKLRKKLSRIVMDNRITGEIVGENRVEQQNRPETNDSPDRHPFVGREFEKEEIMKKLLNLKENHVEVVPIWGMGGVGKTALARSVYNDERATEELYPTRNRIWLCVGENKFVAKEIISKITEGSVTNDNVDTYRQKLNDRFAGDRFLIVLDDVWDVGINEWRSFFNPLNTIKKGGLIIITTRTRKVVTAIDTPVPQYLKLLSCEDCWKIVESHAFNDEHSRRDLELKKDIGNTIVEKLKGLPLAAKAVGHSLSSQHDVNDWRSFLEHETWKLGTGDDDVMPALKWSYDRLLPHLKQCFAYCSLFPKEHAFDEKLLVAMWMAHGFIQREGGVDSRRLEDIGASYFRELVNASLFQSVDGRYVMHDMIHHLSILVSNEKFLRIDGPGLDVGQLEKVHHISIPLRLFWENQSLRISKRSLKRLHTLHTQPETFIVHPTITDIFKRLKRIRVLVLVSDIDNIPECISELIHLRYLDIEKTNVARIPDTLCDLYHLQTLVARVDDLGATILPKNIVNMTNLRHLRARLSTCKGIKNLTSLQELHSISISEGDEINELGDMRQLRGKLTMKCLENVTSEEDAAQAMMQEKTYIDDLELEFTRGLEDTDVQTKVLDALKCPPNLRYLVIRGYNGLKCPSWMVDGKLKNLSELHIRDCDGLEVLELDKVSLTRLTIENCSRLTHITSAVDVSVAVEKSSINIQNLTINHCDQLKYFSRLGKIEELDVRVCKQLTSLTINDRELNSLRSLTVLQCPTLEILIEDALTSSSSAFRRLRLLNFINISKIFRTRTSLKLTSLEADNRPVILKMFEHDPISLREMCIGNISRVESLFNWHKLTSLETLAIFRCEDLESLPPDIFHKLSLKKLCFYGCSILRALPADGLPVSLELLVIAECPLLYRRYQVDSGPDWHKIRHIPKIKILQTISRPEAIELAESFKFRVLLGLYLNN